MERCPTDHAQPPWYLRMDGEMPIRWKYPPPHLQRPTMEDEAGAIRWKAPPPHLQREHQLQQQQLLQQQQQLQQQQLQQQPHNHRAELSQTR